MLLADPTAFEEPLLHSNISISLFPKGEICAVSQIGGVSGITSAAATEPNATSSQAVIFQCIDAATDHLALLRKVVERAQVQLT